jgi:hypothetical protein
VVCRAPGVCIWTLVLLKADGIAISKSNELQGLGRRENWPVPRQNTIRAQTRLDSKIVNKRVWSRQCTIVGRNSPADALRLPTMSVLRRRDDSDGAIHQVSASKRSYVLDSNSFLRCAPRAFLLPAQDASGPRNSRRCTRSSGVSGVAH